MFETVLNLFALLFGKVFSFLFSLNITEDVSLGMVLVVLSTMSLIVFIIFYNINRKEDKK